MAEPNKIQKSIAATGIKNTIPLNDPGLGDGHASYDKGFPSVNFLPKSSGGIPPWGEDMNGFLYELSELLKHYSSGGSFTYDATHQTAVGGYPIGAVLQRADGLGFWLSTVDNNATNPDTGGAGWVALSPERYAVSAGTTSAYTATFNPAINTPYNGMIVTLDTTTTGTNTIAAPTFSPNGATARTIVKEGGALFVGDMPVFARLQYREASLQWVLLNPALNNNRVGVQKFTSNGTFTVPSGVTKIYVSAAAAGGGGGGGGCNPTTTDYAGGGGGGGAGQQVTDEEYTVTPGDSISITIGTGGTGGTASAGVAGTAGGNGGDTVIGALVTLTGGNGGGGGGSPTIFSGGIGGAGYPDGGDGGDGNNSTVVGTGYGGTGSGSQFGDGGQSARSTQSASVSGFAGKNAYGKGAGGGGGSCGLGGDGGDGADGVVIIKW